MNTLHLKYNMIHNEIWQDGTTFSMNVRLLSLEKLQVYFDKALIIIFLLNLYKK